MQILSSWTCFSKTLNKHTQTKYDPFWIKVFEYGENYKHLSSPMRFIPPSSKLTEVMNLNQSPLLTITNIAIFSIVLIFNIVLTIFNIVITLNLCRSVKGNHLCCNVRLGR